MDANTKAKVNELFKRLRVHGVWARQNWKCCSTCAAAAIPADASDRRVFYHAQDADCFKHTGDLYVRYGTVPDDDAATTLLGELVAFLAAEVGLEVEWNGSPYECVVLRAAPPAPTFDAQLLMHHAL
jgi:hypothetical protein